MQSCFLADGSLLGIDFGADLALGREGIAVHDQFHAAGLAGSVFFGTVLSKVAPLPALASHLVGIIKTHWTIISLVTADETWHHILRSTYWLWMGDTLMDDV